MPDDSILEHGQDQSPEETERLKKLRKEASEKERKDIQTVKDVVKDVIKNQREAGSISKDAEQAMQAITEYGKKKALADSAVGVEPLRADKTDKEVESERADKQKGSTEGTGTGLTKEKAAQVYVESLEQAKAVSNNLPQGKTGNVLLNAGQDR